ncbi:MAG: hypothetical protein KJ808_08095 [Acidobacteria bacterium]|nr:hypothetical protein [Acidobacteriota bacterium]MBU4405064.1 hypothetical protein [Acidobacteriota bacterium]MCG2811686.1 hypothetical protein [Candidatus Aminicenantes bacterium]
MTKQRERPARWRRLWPLVLLAVVSLLLHAAKWHRLLEVQGLFDQWATLAATRPVEETKVRRARFYKSRFYLGYPASASYATADLVRRIADISQPPVRLLAIQIDLGLHDLGFELTIEVAAAGPKAVRRKLAFFLKRLRDLPRVFQANPSPASLAAEGSGGRVFIINGRAELS